MEKARTIFLISQYIVLGIQFILFLILRKNHKRILLFFLNIGLGFQFGMILAAFVTVFLA